MAVSSQDSFSDTAFVEAGELMPTDKIRDLVKQAAKKHCNKECLIWEPEPVSLDTGNSGDGVYKVPFDEGPGSWECFVTVSDQGTKAKCTSNNPLERTRSNRAMKQSL